MDIISVDSILRFVVLYSFLYLESNVPRYLVMEFSAAEQEQLAADEDVMAVSKRLIEKNRQAYEVLAK